MRIRDRGFPRARRLPSARLASSLGLVVAPVPAGWARAMRRAPKRRGPVIAGVVALVLLAAPSLAVASASGRAGGPRATTAVVNRVDPNDPDGIWNGTLAEWHAFNVAQAKEQRKKLIRGLAANAAKVVGPGLVEGLAFAAVGWVLDQWGYGGGGIDDQIAEIRTQLNEIQNTLNKIDAATTQLRTELADSHFSNLVSQASGIVASVDTDAKELDAIARMGADDPTKADRTRRLLDRIDRDLMGGRQKELADRISGTVGADGLIAAAYKEALAHHRLWTLMTSLQVREVVAYYETAEARLLMLRVEFMHAHHYKVAEIETAISEVEGYLHKQDNELKPNPGADVIADTRSHLEWLAPGLGYESTAHQAQTFAVEVGSTGLFPVPKYERTGPFGFPKLVGVEYFNVGTGWRLPGEPEVLNLIAGWSDPSGSWIHWLHRETGGLVSASAAPRGVWTSHIAPVYAIGIDRGGALRISGGGLTPTEELRSPFLVKARPHNYW